MKKRTFVLASIISMALIASGCSKKDEPELQPKEEKVVVEDKTETDKKEKETPKKEETQKDESVEKTEEKVISKYTGKEITKEQAENTVIMAIIENSRAARPQKGISLADIVFETEVEYGITRYIALFAEAEADQVGPVRSTRPYLQNLISTFDVGYAHCGGSNQAIAEISTKKLNSLNQMVYGDYYWRDKSRKAPHNLYTSTDKLRKLSEKKGYLEDRPLNLNFVKLKEIDNSLEGVSKMKVKPSSYVTSGFEYNKSKNEYLRIQDEEPDVDAANKKQISVQNVVVQLTDVKDLNDAEKHVDVKMLGKGEGYLFNAGKMTPITWEKKDYKSHTKLLDQSGKEINLVEGKTWWYIVDKNSEVSWE